MIGTPFHASGRLPGVGLDCAGLPICIARELAVVTQSFDVPNYIQTPDGVTLLKWCRAYMRYIPKSHMKAGDVLITKTRDLPQHISIVADYIYGGHFSQIHACNCSDPPRVIETRLMFSSVQQYVASFVLPGITD